MILLELIKGIILGIVEGLTECAPVSSTGHLILVDDMWLKSTQYLGPEAACTFEIVIQLGSVFARAWVFRERYFEMLHIEKYSSEPIDGIGQKPKRLNILHMIVGMIPAGILGFM